MSWLLDTNVISEWVKPRPDAGVVAWLAAADEDRLHVSVLTLAEIRLGIERLELGGRRDRLRQWLDNDLARRFVDRTIPIDRAIAETWAVLVGQCMARGLPPAVIDGFIAATAAARGLTLVTRNTRHFEPFGIPLHDPWRATRRG